MNHRKLAKLDHKYLWHPFTQMRDWLKREPIVIVEGHGAVLRDDRGREYLDANSSIWTNLHGHQHPKLNAALKAQLEKSPTARPWAWQTNPPASWAPDSSKPPIPQFLTGCMARDEARQEVDLAKVFFSDNGSTAVEVALKLAYEFARRTGRSPKPRFLSLNGAYHGDTVGAVALGHIDLFHAAYSGLLFRTDKVMAPYCYRCPFNRAKPDRADARRLSPVQLGMPGPGVSQIRIAKEAGQSLCRVRFRAPHARRRRHDSRSRKGG